MRADRLVSLVLLLRQRGRMTAGELAKELEVSARTVLRDIEALSSAGVPVYADRGRHGGFSLLPGFRTELTGLSHEEALAIAVGAGRATTTFGLGTALASAVRKVVDALPDGAWPDDASRRFLVEPAQDLLSRTNSAEEIPREVMREVRGAVLSGHRLRFRYAARAREPTWHTVDPIGLVTVRDRTYLLATKSGDDRTYRMSRIVSAEATSEPADRPDDADLERLWAQRAALFLAEDHLRVQLRIRPERRSELLAAACDVRSEEHDGDGWLLFDVDFEDERHAVWAVWQLDVDAEVLAPAAVVDPLRQRASILNERYR